MKRFRTKKRGKEEGVDGPEEQDKPLVPVFKTGRTFRRGKKSKDSEPQLELDVANALPSQDDFRTSLLMNGLSARFSMLREQDDPTTKIGKASDDSVLTPKRHSRLVDFGFHSHGLADIAEVASIKDSVRRPFASDRIGSYHSADGYGTDDDIIHNVSVMARAKPGESNSFFGGRQKIYKISAGTPSPKNLTPNGEMRTMGGRALYDDDVSQSSFQKLKETERAHREFEQRVLEENHAALPRRSDSPPLTGYNRNRETSSTTSDGPSLTRSSTAATSITSQRAPSVQGYNMSSSNIPPQSSAQPLDRSLTKTKRLYETGSDHHLHSQQLSAANRLENLNRQRTLDTQSPSPSPHSNTTGGFDNSHGHNTWGQPNIKTGAATSTSGPFGSFNFGIKATDYAETSKPSYGVVPPLSPPMSDVEEQISLPIQPNDRGKATAMGTFSKPAQPYDEKKYTQRQLQMQQGRETPPLRKHSAPRTPNQQDSSRSRAESNATNASVRSQSSTNSQPVHQNRSLTPQLNLAEAPKPKPSPVSGSSSFPGERQRGLARDLESDIPPMWNAAPAHTTLGKPNSPDRTLRAPQEEHPAMRQANSRSPRLYRDFTEMSNDPTSSVSVSEAPVNQLARKAVPNDIPADSPTQGPGLSSMVLQHLRSDSNSSSIYGSPSPSLFSRSPGGQMGNGNTQSKSPVPQNWEQNRNANLKIVDVGVNGGPVRLHQPLVEFSGEERTHVTQEPSKTAWEKELEVHHSRDGSTETQKERLEFANELATRRRQVQMNLRSFAESDSRSQSPAPGLEFARETSTPNSNLQGLKSRGSVALREGPSKALKILGMVQTSPRASPRPARIGENLWKREEEEMLRNLPKSPRPLPETKAFRQARREAQRDRERQLLLRGQRETVNSEDVRSQRETVNSEDVRSQVTIPPVNRNGSSSNTFERKSDESQHLNGATTQSRNLSLSQPQRVPRQEGKDSGLSSSSTSRPSSNSARDRSSSDASARSKSRNGRYRDDLAKAMAGGIGSSAQGSFEDVTSVRGTMKSPAFPNGFQNTPPNQSPIISANSSSVNSKPLASGYFDGQQLQPIQINHSGDLSLPSRASPAAPFSANTTPALLPSPIGPGYSHISQGFQSQGRIAPSFKRQVNKADISEPTLVSTTSRITTVTLPAAAAMQAELGFQFPSPALPAIDPRRLQQRSHLTLNGNATSGALTTPSTPSLSSDYPDEMSAFSGDEADPKQKQRIKLRKSSSDGGNLHLRARQAFTTSPSPALPSSPFPSSGASQEQRVDGGMF